MVGPNPPSLGVIILGAGTSSRMGRPKLLLPWRDTTIIGHIISQWRELSAEQIVVGLRPDDALLAAELNRLAFSKSDRIENSHSERGMFSSILCAAHWTGWRSNIATLAIALGDQPHLQLETLCKLLAFHAKHPGAICQPEFEGHARHPVLLPRQIFEELKHTPAETLKEFLKLKPRPIVQYSVADAGLSLDLDTPEDYKEAITHFNAHEKS
jgi:molybdenum cofactor cytidylyltransferase